MRKIFNSVLYWGGVLLVGLIVANTIKLASAWVEPDQMPPGGNIAAPINTGNSGQIKTGGLILNTGGATLGLIVEKGLVGIGTDTPQATLDVNGDIKARILNLNNNLYVGGDTNIAGNNQVGGNLNVNGDIYGKNIYGNVNSTSVCLNGDCKSSWNSGNEINWSNPVRYSTGGWGYTAVTTEKPYKVCFFQGGYIEISGNHGARKNGDGTWTGWSDIWGGHYGSVIMDCLN